MNRPTFRWTLAAIPVALLAPICIAVGLRLMPSRTEASELGKLVPWIIGWALTWMTAIAAVALAGAMATTRTGHRGRV